MSLSSLMKRLFALLIILASGTLFGQETGNLSGVEYYLEPGQKFPGKAWLDLPGSWLFHNSNDYRVVVIYRATSKVTGISTHFTLHLDAGEKKFLALDNEISAPVIEQVNKESSQ